MNKNALKRKILAEFSGIPLVALLALMGAALLLGILIAISGVSFRIPIVYYMPRGLLPMFFMAIFWGISYALLGGMIAIWLFSRSCSLKSYRFFVFLLLFSLLILFYTWFPVVYRAGALFLGLLLCGLMLAFLLFLLRILWSRHFLMTCGLIFLSSWTIYVFYYTFSLFLLNG